MDTGGCTGAVAAIAFVPWARELIPVYRNKSGLSPNLGWREVPTFYDLKLIFADYLGIPGFHGATTLVLLIGVLLTAFALPPASSAEDKPLDLRKRLTLVLMALLPPLLAFGLSRWPFNLPIFGERHLLPSILALLLLVCRGLWRLSARVPKRFRLLVLVAGAIALSVLQALPVGNRWLEPSREPYAAVPDWLRRSHPDLPVFTSWPYGIGEPVAFYLGGGRRIEELPADPAKLPERCIVLYRPAESHEDAAVHSLLGRFDVTEAQYYSAHDSRWGTRLLVLHKRSGVANP